MATKIMNAGTVVAKMPECYLGSGQWLGPKRGQPIYQVAKGGKRKNQVVSWMVVLIYKKGYLQLGYAVCTPKISQGQYGGISQGSGNHNIPKRHQLVVGHMCQKTTW